MKISARNKLLGKVAELKVGAVNTVVKIQLTAAPPSRQSSRMKPPKSLALPRAAMRVPSSKRPASWSAFAMKVPAVAARSSSGFKAEIREGEAPAEPAFVASSARQEPRPPGLRPILSPQKPPSVMTNQPDIPILEARKTQVHTKGTAPFRLDCEKQSVAGSVSQRACVFCGSRVVLYPIADALHLVHGPIGCAAYTWDIRGAQSSGSAVAPHVLLDRSSRKRCHLRRGEKM